MYDDMLRGTGGLALSLIGITAGDVMGWVSAFAALFHAVFLAVSLIARLVVAIRKRVKGHTTDGEFVAEIDGIVEDAESIKEDMTKNEFPE